MANDVPALMVHVSKNFMKGKIDAQEFRAHMERYWIHGRFDNDDLAWLAQAVIDKDKES